MLRGLANCTADTLGEGVRVLTLSEGRLPFYMAFAATSLYERSFYPHLLNTIRSRRNVVLISNPGTGKSMFQLYYLAHLLNPALGQLPDVLPSPEVIVRQIGQSSFSVYFLQDRIAHEIYSCSIGVLKCFDPTTTVYFFEPDSSHGIEPYLVELPTFCTCSPELTRYKEFCKHGGHDLYMPLFTEDELVTIGGHMRHTTGFPDELAGAYTEAAIRMRFHGFDGIIRHVLPHDVQSLSRASKERRLALTSHGTLLRQLLQASRIDSSQLSHHIIKYDVVRDGLEAFSEVSYSFVSAEVRALVEEYAYSMSLGDRISLLICSRTVAPRHTSKWSGVDCAREYGGR